MEGTSVSVSAASEITMEKVGATTTTTDERDEMTNLSDHVQTNLNINSSNIVGGGGGGGGINIVTSSGEDEGASGNDGFNCRRIQVSREKRPLSFFVTLSKKFLLTDDMIELSGLGLAVTTVVTIAEILKKSNLISIKRIQTSLVEAHPEGSSMAPKAKIQVWIEKTAEFEEAVPMFGYFTRNSRHGHHGHHRGGQHRGGHHRGGQHHHHHHSHHHRNGQVNEEEEDMNHMNNANDINGDKIVSGEGVGDMIGTMDMAMNNRSEGIDMMGRSSVDAVGGNTMGGGGIVGDVDGGGAIGTGDSHAN